MDERTEENDELWAFAEGLQASTRPLRYKFNIQLPGLVSAIQTRLRPVKLAGVSVEWECEPYLGGSTAKDCVVATSKANDLDVLMVLRPSIRGRIVTVEPQRSKCSLVSISEQGRDKKEVRIAVGDTGLDNIWKAFTLGIKDFTEQYRDILEIPEVRDADGKVQAGEWAKFEDDPTAQMWASFSFGATDVDVLPAFVTGADVCLVLLRKSNADGSNIVKSFSSLGERRIKSLPDKARQLICALKHVVKVVHGIKVPGCLFESVVLEVFETQRWVGALSQDDLDGITFIDAWHRCWNRILDGRPIAAPNKALTPDENLFVGISEANTQELKHLGRELVALAEKALHDRIVRNSTGAAALAAAAVPASTASSSSTSTSTSSSGQDGEDDDLC